jgi:hypothetical protein
MVCKQCKVNPLTVRDKEATQAGLCVACWEKPFAITSVCRGDLLEYLTPVEIGCFDDGDMGQLAGKMADAYLDSVFWIDLEILSKYLLGEAEAGR